MTPTPDMLAQAHLQGHVDGMQGSPLPELHDALVEAYAEGRRIGTARSGRLPPPRVGLFDNEFCRAVLASNPLARSAAGIAENASSAPLGLVADSPGVVGSDGASLTQPEPAGAPQ